MNYRIVNINAGSPTADANVLIIYTGGTIGMITDDSGSLISFNFKNIIEKIPVLKSLNTRITVISFPEPIDSSDVNLNHWVDIGYIIYENYNQYDGFVVLHGTDTMAYSASALSFILEGLSKPVIFTGAQLPIGATRSDARENLITALEIATTRLEGKPVVPEVCIYFNNHLLRGNRAKKAESIHFDAFESENYPPLAEAGVVIDYNLASIIERTDGQKLKFNHKLDSNVAILKLFPGMSRTVVESILNISGLKGVVMETYGSGNATTEKWFLECLEEAISKGIIVLNVSQCTGGRVLQGRYETSRMLPRLGVLSGSDLTTEAAITKMMVLLGTESDPGKVKERLVKPICGEMS
ncbi:asparaginase [Roseivirga sp. BDSF3-8]|uniref:asparaginase n=1 Tax=Roseivirga sp. BDSF3-8 TaxID=3241598 RepID=UPI003531C309